MKTTSHPATTIDKYAIYALALNALSEYSGLSEGCEIDIRWPEDDARAALDWESEMNKTLSPSTAFGIAFRFGLVLGAQVAVNPLEKHDLRNVIDEFKGELARESSATSEDKATAFLKNLRA